MKIEINLKILFMIIIFLIFNNIEMYLIFFVFILIHEMAHLIVGLIIGGVPKRMSLNAFGISLEFYSYGKENVLYKIIFYLIGPLINFACAILFLKLKNYQFYKEEIIYTNLAICFFNLIPIYPLDGGKIVKELLKVFIGIDKSNEIMIIFSKIFLFIISFVYSIFIIKIKNIMILFLIIYLWYLLIIEEKKYEIYKKTKNSVKKIIS